MWTTCTSAPAANLIHMHGELAKSRCERDCGRPPVEDRAVYASLDEVGRCPCGGRLRPHIVFFGEIPLEMPRIEHEIENSTLMLVVGTSGSVYPAANFVHWARQAGARTSTSAPSRPSTPPPSPTSWKAKQGSSAGAFSCREPSSRFSPA